MVSTILISGLWSVFIHPSLQKGIGQQLEETKLGDQKAVNSSAASHGTIAESKQPCDQTADHNSTLISIPPKKTWKSICDQAGTSAEVSEVKNGCHF